jgi:SAM-dependent methyltransferase
MRFARELVPGTLEHDEQPVTRLLYERLGEEMVAEVERAAKDSPERAALGLDVADPSVHEWAVLHFGMWLSVPGVAESTGLPLEQPPANIHTMAHGPIAAAGGLYEADLIASALDSSGAHIERLTSALDFGCSSGRVLRVLAAAYPEVQWSGCDPNAAAIAWAREHLPGAQFSVSGDEPPLPLESESLDLVFAVSVWSHFEPDLGLRWFEEMRRVLRRGGHLILTTHGLTTVAYDAEHGRRSSEQLEDIRGALYRRGWWYAPEFGEQGDWGVTNPAWGTAFLAPEWLLAELCPRWRVAEFAPGRDQGNQDVYVLERV